MALRFVPPEIDAARDIAELAAQAQTHTQASDIATDPLASFSSDDWYEDGREFASALSLASKKPFGRPRVLHPDATTLHVLRAMARVQATQREICDVLGVTEPTFVKFREDYPEVKEALVAPAALSKVSLRRQQIEQAMAGNATMLIWTGKQYLGQTDKNEVKTTLSLESLVMQSLGVSSPDVIEGEARAVEDRSGETEL